MPHPTLLVQLATKTKTQQTVKKQSTVQTRREEANRTSSIHQDLPQNSLLLPGEAGIFGNSLKPQLTIAGSQFGFQAAPIVASSNSSDRVSGIYVFYLPMSLTWMSITQGHCSKSNGWISTSKACQKDTDEVVPDSEADTDTDQPQTAYSATCKSNKLMHMHHPMPQHNCQYCYIWQCTFQLTI